MTPSTAGGPRRVIVTREGPVLIEGPVEIVRDDGRVFVSDRAVVAVCGCKRSRCYPFCDTSHRKRSRSSTQPDNAVTRSGDDG
jgi:CDGSH-type Zn-finger protein